MRGLYLHIPFCEHKCIYCDFYSIEQSGGYEGFVDALLKEIAMTAEALDDNLMFTSVFFGGGTPSLLATEQLRRILDGLHRAFLIAPDAECTVETNPGTVDIGKLRAYHRIGVNRLSIGVQSFVPGDLEFLTRIHSVQDAKRCFNDAREAGYDNINIDLMFALPTHTRERWLQNLEYVTALAPDHISAYSLTYEEGTPLYKMKMRREVVPLDEATDAELYNLTIDTLEEAGYEQYEISNFARPGKKCLHNRTYWEYHEYLGFGPSAHSFYNGKRYWNIKTLNGYYRHIDEGMLPVAGEETLTDLQRAGEEIFLGLRTMGVDLKKIKNFYNLDLLDVKTAQITNFSQRGLIVVDNGILRLTKQGKAFADMIASELM
jgi:oxygen-independent coproporphyrinogen III oxidase